VKIRLQTTWSPAGANDLYLDQFPAVVGRAEHCNISVPLGFISRRHCQFIRREDGQVIVQDLESLNGTFVNGSQITRPTPIRHGDEVRLGPMSFRVVILSGDDISTMCVRSSSSEMTVS
jgi:pSer/pThr/pTyr-binding forkhead associated (FHA) protein